MQFGLDPDDATHLGAQAGIEVADIGIAGMGCQIVEQGKGLGLGELGGVHPDQLQRILIDLLHVSHDGFEGRVDLESQVLLHLRVAGRKHEPL